MAIRRLEMPILSCLLLLAGVASFFHPPAAKGAEQQASIPKSWGPQEPPFRPSHPIAIVGGTLIDATGAPPKIEQTVVIEGNRITAIGRNEDVPIPQGAQIIDAKGMTIMPGIINSNQHLQLNPLYSAPAADMPLAVLKARWEDVYARMPDRAYVYLMQGITSMRHTSGPWHRILPVKKRIDSGEAAGPRIFLGGALLMSDEYFEYYLKAHHTPKDAREWLAKEFAYHVVKDVDADTNRFLGSEFNFWKLLMSDEAYDGKNDFSDEELRFIINKAHTNGKHVDVHATGTNAGLRRMLAFDVDTLEHPFYGTELIEEDIIKGYVKKGVIVDSLLVQMISPALRRLDPHRFNETLYISSMRPDEYRVLLRYRDKMLYNQRHPDSPEVPIYQSPGADAPPPSDGRTYNEVQARRATSVANMRRFIREGAKLSLGTDTPAFLNFQQEDPNAQEFRFMIEQGMSPMDAIIAATRNGAEALGMLDQLGTIEKGKLADVIVVAGNPLVDPNALKRVYAVIKDGVRYK
ncbi:MAG TPA: amidohydrolase family protein [Steroidobacteraceae bacterium]|nr:amidohydrolase family protein [Steroidobacteraceae bacterium]